MSPIVFWFILMNVLAQGGFSPIAQAQEGGDVSPFARARLDPDSSVTVGQPVLLTVEVFVPTWFTGAPKFPSLEVPDALVIFNERGSNLSEQIDGETWAGQSREYTIYPQRAKSYSIPRVPIEVKYFSKGVSSGAKSKVSPSLVTFKAHIPEEAKGLRDFIATPQLELTQTFDRKPDTLKIGEAFTRTITVTVHNALSMVIPAIVIDPMDGLSLYADPAVVQDRGGERGEAIVGTRVETVTYVAQKEGEYHLPPIELAWWDVKGQRLRKAHLPGVVFQVEPKRAFENAIPLQEDLPSGSESSSVVRKRVSLLDLLKQWGVPLGLAFLVFLILVNLYRRYAPSLHEQLAQSRKQREESESTWFGYFREAVQSEKPEGTYRSLMSWLDRLYLKNDAATVKDFTDDAEDPLLKEEVEKLETLLFDSPDRKTMSGVWNGANLLKLMTRARALRTISEKRRKEQVRLEPLNPS